MYSQSCMCEYHSTKSDIVKKGFNTKRPRWEGKLMNHLATDKFFYYGMLNKNYANGLGRATGKWGMYEGNFKNGKPSGYGRLIVNSTKYWYGFFDDIKK